MTTLEERLFQELSEHPETLLMTISEAMQIFKCSKSSVLRRIDSGEWPSVKTASTTYLLRSGMAKLLAESYRPSPFMSTPVTESN